MKENVMNKAKRRAYMKRYRKEHKNEINDSKAKYRKTHKIEISKYNKEYYNSHKKQ